MALNNKKKNKAKLLDDFGNFKEDAFNIDLISSYFQKRANYDSLQTLSDKTCNDLDFDALFAYIDRTNSKVGQQYLYNTLRNIPSGSQNIAVNEALIAEFTRNADFRVHVQALLSKLNSAETFYLTALFQDEHLKKPGWFYLVPILSLSSLFALITVFFIPKAFLFLLSVFLVNMGIHYRNKQNLLPYLASLPQLLRLNGVARELFKSDTLKTINPSLTVSISIVNKVRNRMSFFNLEAKMQSDFQIVAWALLELFKIAFLFEPLLLFGVLKQLDTKRKEIEDIFVFVGHIDSLVSVASLRKGLSKFCMPSIIDEPENLVIRDAYHPLIADCVENSIDVSGKSILLTGSNMSGKTSFIRTVAINVITGFTLNTCFASQFVMPRLHMFSAIRISDDLMNDRSYYFEEVLTIKEMIDNSSSGKPNLFLLDEIFKGTNTIERIAAGKAVLSALAKAGNIVFVSTHDIELADLLKDEYDLYHFSEKIDNKNIDFDYKLKEGKLRNRNAIRILQINNYPVAVIDEALMIAKGLDGK